MSQPNITIQLFTLRDALADRLEDTLREVAEIGFGCVEPAGYSGQSPKAYAALLKSCGLTAPTAHCELPIGDAKNEVIEAALEIGHRYLITGGPPGWRDRYGTADEVKAAAELYCQAAENAAAHGLQIGYHNHDWDLAEMDGVPAYQIFLSHTPESVLWEADLFWVARAGLDPVGFLTEIGPRGKALHFKDGDLGPNAAEPPFLPAGEGDVDLLATAAAARSAEFIAVELDAYTGDMLEAVRRSYRYLTEKGVAVGKR